MYPTKEEKDKVAFMIIEAYPFLADSLGAGIGSWSMAIHNRFKNMRRKPRTPAVKNQEQPARSIQEPMLKKRKVDDIPELADGETEETCKEHTKHMKAEMAKSKRNASVIKELMQLTYPYRRQQIINGIVTDVLQEYPALKLVSEVRTEFGRIVEDPKIVKKMVQNFEVVEKKILQLAENSSNKTVKSLLNEMKNAVLDEPSKQADIESTIAVLLLQHHLKDKSCNNPLLMICSVSIIAVTI
ncbi:sterile alpha motif domain-containing protein 3-like [Dendronephthya gigantea]|nr:sterile alpha motif domain-containing protein 3-like [Dendronephthya gigantea]